MPDPYRSRRRRSETPSSSSGGSHYNSPQYHYSPADLSNLSCVPEVPPSYGSHLLSQNGDSMSGYDNYHRTSGSFPTGVVSRHSPYSVPMSPSFPSEHASKRQRRTTAVNQAQAQWVDTSARGYVQPMGRRGGSDNMAQNESHRGGRQSSVSSVSSGYSSPHYHRDVYGRQHLHPHGLGPHLPSLDDEYIEHGPTEFPPRTYVGKSQYDQPKKPGKIPGSAMDYLPILEARFDRLETAIDKYVNLRGKQALSNSILPGMEQYETSSTRDGSSLSRYSRESSRR